MTIRTLFLSAAVLGTAAAAHAGDIPGSRDPQGLKRFQGSEIVRYVTRSFDHYSFALGPGTPSDGFTKAEAMEGAVTRVIYRIGEGHTALELTRNYEDMLKSAGFKTAYEFSPCGNIPWSGYFVGRFFAQGGPGDNNPFNNVGTSCYVYAKGLTGGKASGVAVLAGEVTSAFTIAVPGVKDPIKINVGDVLVGVDEVIAIPVPKNMTK